MDMDALYAAAISGDADAISKLDMEADKFGKNGKTILHTESISGNTERVRLILREFGNKHLLPKLTNFNQSALQMAACFGHTKLVEILVDAARKHFLSSSSPSQNPVTSFQAYVRQPDKSLETALHGAVIYGRVGHVDIVKLLVEADPSHGYLPDLKGRTPIYVAAEKGYEDILKVLCTTCTAQSLDGPGGSTSVLHVLIKNNQEAKEKDMVMMSLIIDAAKRWSNAEDASENFLEALFNRTDESGRSILDLAVERNNLEAAELILTEDPAYERGGKRNSLMRLIYRAIQEEHKDLVKLLSKTYEVGIQPRHKGVVDLILSIQKRDKASVLRVLGDNKHLASFVDDQGWTPLHYAAHHEFDSVLKAITDAQKNVGYQFLYEEMVTTPFHVAAGHGYTSTVIQLMQLWPVSSSAYTSVNKNGENIIHLAASKNKKEMIQDILEYCPENYKDKILNQQDVNGDTPLHLLISHGCFIPELIKHKTIDTMVKNKKKWTPRDMLYHEDEIIADQVHIKIALDAVQTNLLKTEIADSLVLPSKRQRKDVMFDKFTKELQDENNARMKRDLDRYRNTHDLADWFADASAGDAVARAALEMEADFLNEEGKTFLHRESMVGDTERVRFLVTDLANKNLLVKLDIFKQTALHPAAQYGHTGVVEALIDAARHLPSSTNEDPHNTVTSFQSVIRQANVPARNTALHLAVLNGNMEIVKLLVGADPNDRHIQNREGKTPIYMAVENGKEDIIKVICTNCTALSLEGPGGTTTAFHVLIKNIQEREKGKDVIRMFIDAARRWTNVEDASNASFKALFDSTDESGSTVLQLAVEINYVDAVELILLEDPAYQQGSKKHGLMGLIYKAIDKEYSKDIIKLLSEAYEVGINSDHKGVLALILAIKEYDKESVINLLRNFKHLVCFTDDEGWTPLHYAAYHEFVSILEAIIEAQKEFENQFAYGEMVSTPFHVAAEYGYTSMLIRLMQLWPSSSSAYTAPNKNGQNILHLAAASNRKEMVQGILKYCPEKYKEKILKEQDSSGNTPLHLLISHGCFIPELIKHKRLDTTAKNKRNCTPRDMLYFEDYIVADQVQIKIALDDVQTNQSAWKFWGKSMEKKTDIWESIVPPSKRETKDVIFNEGKKLLMDTKHEQMKKDLERYKMRTNTQIIVTALITTVTFTVGFTMPGGLRQSGEVDEGLVLLSKRTAFNAFMVSDALALLLSTSSLFFYFLESMNEDPLQVSKLNAASTVLNIVSVMAMMLTFIAGTYVVLSNSPALAITVCIIGSLFFLLIIILLIKIVYDRQKKKNKD